MARKYKRLRYEDRQVIEKMSRAGSRVVDIAATLGVHRDTIYKEYARCGATADTYSAEKAGTWQPATAWQQANNYTLGAVNLEQWARQLESVWMVNRF